MQIFLFSLLVLSQCLFGGQRGEKPLHPSIPSLMGKFQIPGVAVATIKNSDQVVIECYGYSDKERKTLLKPESLFQVGSISKTITAYGVLKLIQQKGISLDDSIENYISSWPISDSSLYDLQSITVRRLLNHTSGLGIQSYSGYKNPTHLPTLRESINGAHGAHRILKLADEPGTAFRYTGGGYSLLQLFIEDVAGESFQGYMQREVLCPIGLASSTFERSSDDQMSMCRSYGVFGQALPHRYFVEQAAAGLCATVGDLASFISYNLAAYQASDDNMLAAMTHVDEDSYALGYEVEHLGDGTLLAYHLGANPGWRAGMFLLPQLGLGYVVLTNSDNGMGLITEIASEWVFLETGQVPSFYTYAQQEHRVIQAATLLMGIGLVSHILYAIWRKKKRTLRQALLQMSLWITFAITWGVVFYSPFIHPDGWVIGAFMPDGLLHLTIVSLLWSVFGAAQALKSSACVI